MGVVLLPCHGPQQGFKLSVRYFLYLQMAGHVYNLPCLRHGCHHECGKIRADVLVQFDQVHQWHLLGQSPRNVKEQSLRRLPPAIYATWHKVHARALALSKRCDGADVLHQECSYVFGSLVVASR